MTAVRLLHAIVDVLSSKNNLAACLLAMEMCQMVAQGMHVKDPPLMQIPGVSRSLAEKCEREGVTSHATSALLFAVCRTQLVCKCHVLLLVLARLFETWNRV